MSYYYPAFLRLEGRPCLVIGGGTVAEGKVNGLLTAGARVTLISPDATPSLQHLAEQGRIVWEHRQYREGDLEGYFLAIAVTDDRAVNQQAWEEAERRRILFNAGDDPVRCNFILPALHRQGDLVIAVSTHGKSPALAVRLRDHLAQEIGPEYAEFIALLGELRDSVAKRCSDPEARRRLWYRIVDSEALAHIRVGNREKALKVIQALVQEAEREEVQA